MLRFEPSTALFVGRLRLGPPSGLPPQATFIGWLVSRRIGGGAPERLVVPTPQPLLGCSRSECSGHRIAP